VYAVGEVVGDVGGCLEVKGDLSPNHLITYLRVLYFHVGVLCAEPCVEDRVVVKVGNIHLVRPDPRYSYSSVLCCLKLG
jgi:hypothetical protein